MELATGTGMKIEGKGEVIKNMAIGRIIRDSTPVCAFSAAVGIITDAMLPEIVSPLIGDVWSADDMKKVGTRIMCQERLFNMREGITRQDDTLPARLLEEPKPDGAAKGIVVPLEELKEDYYRAMGWDLSTGNPNDSILNELEITR